ncbi:MAG: translation initiation factor IF-2 [bacterium]
MKKTKISTIKLLRTPIIAVMGHVDHGKTTLLDAIRGTNVQSGEAGGITQNTRAHSVVYHGQKLTFIDTPGHQAFSEMRSRGAKVTDIVLLVVAADDGVQPQTKESIKFALESKVPILVAINKIDLQGKKIEKLRQELASSGILLEQHGGDVMSVEVSATKKTGLDELMESILLLAEISELKKNLPTKGVANAFILESTMNDHLGPVSLMILKAGKIDINSFVVYEGGYSRVRNMLDEQQKPMLSAEEGDPVWIIGLKKVLEIGETVQFVATEKEAKELSKKVEKGEVQLLEEEPEAAADEITDLDLLSDLFTAKEAAAEIKYLKLILKADTQGTLEAIVSELNKLDDEEVKVKILSKGTGDLTEQDVVTAKNSRGIVIGFQVKAPAKVLALAKKDRVLLRQYKIIYELLDEVADVMDSLGDPIVEEIEVARARVKKVFKLTNGQYVAGSEVVKGIVQRGYKVFVERGEERVTDARIASLRQNKNEVKEMHKGMDCGILLDPNIELQEGDEIVCFKVEKL